MHAATFPNRVSSLNHCVRRPPPTLMAVAVAVPAPALLHIIVSAAVNISGGGRRWVNESEIAIFNANVELCFYLGSEKSQSDTAETTPSPSSSSSPRQLQLSPRIRRDATEKDDLKLELKTVELYNFLETFNFFPSLTVCLSVLSSRQRTWKVSSLEHGIRKRAFISRTWNEWSWKPTSRVWTLLLTNQVNLKQWRSLCNASWGAKTEEESLLVIIIEISFSDHEEAAATWTSTSSERIVIVSFLVQKVFCYGNSECSVGRRKARHEEDEERREREKKWTFRFCTKFHFHCH